jgi:hypothetical protein
MSLAHERTENAGVLRYLAHGGRPAQAAVQRPPDDVDTWRLGAHPDIVEQLWTRLNAALPVDCRFLVADTAALVHPESGIIIAVTLGTQYALRLTGSALEAARVDGFETRHRFATVGRTLDLDAAFGPGWVFGRHHPREGQWLAESAPVANL